MTIHTILKMGDPRLLRIAPPVTQFDTDELHLLVRRAIPPPGPLQRVHVVDFAAVPALPADLPENDGPIDPDSTRSGKDD